MKITKNLVFDFDNTIARNTESTDEDIYNIVKKWNPDRTKRFLMEIIQNATSDYQICTDLIPKKHIKSSYEKILDINIKKVKKAYYSPKILELLSYLNKYFQLHIISGRDLASLKHSLKTHAVDNYFTEIIGGDSGFNPKPSYESLAYISKKYNIPLGQMVYVGDAQSDYIMAKYAQCKFIGVSWYGENNIKDKTCLCETIDSFSETIKNLFE